MDSDNLDKPDNLNRAAEKDRPGRKPPWLRVRAPAGQKYRDLRQLMSAKSLHTVCEEANCPNLGHCWGSGTATFLLLGDVCTRNCRFCNIKTAPPAPLDGREPEHVAEAVSQMGLRHAVLTSVTRDDLPDGGAHVFARSIELIREKSPGCTVEVLIPDFRGDAEALKAVMYARPDILNHNVETVPRLYPVARPQADYARSLELLRRAKEFVSDAVTKSGIMVGLGETPKEVTGTMRDLRACRVDILTIGQYLQPTRQHLPVDRYWHPDEFDRLREEGLKMGFEWVESGPLVRSSYHAGEQADALVHHK